MSTPAPFPPGSVKVSPHITRSLFERERSGNSRSLRQAIENQTIRNIAQDAFQSHELKLPLKTTGIKRAGHLVAAKGPNSTLVYDLRSKQKVSEYLPDTAPPEFTPAESLLIDENGIAVQLYRKGHLFSVKSYVEFFLNEKKTASLSYGGSHSLFVNGTVFRVGETAEKALYEYDIRGNILSNIPLDALSKSLFSRDFEVVINGDYFVLCTGGVAPKIFVLDRLTQAYKITDLKVSSSNCRIDSLLLEGNRLLISSTNRNPVRTEEIQKDDPKISILNLFTHEVEKEFPIAEKGSLQLRFANGQTAFFSHNVEKVGSLGYSIDLSTGKIGRLLKIPYHKSNDLFLSDPLLTVYHLGNGESVIDIRTRKVLKTIRNKNLFIDKSIASGIFSAIRICRTTPNPTLYIEDFSPH